MDEFAWMNPHLLITSAHNSSASLQACSSSLVGGFAKMEHHDGEEGNKGCDTTDVATHTHTDPELLADNRTILGPPPT